MLQAHQRRHARVGVRNTGVWLWLSAAPFDSCRSSGGVSSRFSFVNGFRGKGRGAEGSADYF